MILLSERQILNKFTLRLIKHLLINYIQFVSWNLAVFKMYLLQVKRSSYILFYSTF